MRLEMGSLASASKDNYLTEAYIQRIEEALEDKSSIGRLSYWLEKHTRLSGRPFHFNGHEYQREIVDSTHHNNVVIKPSQVGMTEGIIRLILGFLAVEKNAVSMYLLPTLGDSNRMAKSRVDPVIAGSKMLSSLIKAGNDSASFKQIGSSQLVMGGTYGKEIISVPTDLLVLDEFDFCDQTNSITAESRLTHSEYTTLVDDTLVRGIKFKFSTPTAENWGVDLLYRQSDRRVRMVKCLHCGHWFAPDFYDHCVIQGFDRPMEELTYLDALALDEKGLVPTTQLLCPNPSCRRKITQDNLRPPNREWVAEFPHVKNTRGFRVTPFDVPDYHSPASIVRKLIDYEDKTGKFKNYVLGKAHSDASNSFLDAVAKLCTAIRPVLPAQAAAQSVYNCVAGLDIGKTSWLVIGRKNFLTRKMEVLHLEQIRLLADGETLKTLVLERLQQYGVTLLVCDIMPFTDSILQIQRSRPEGWVMPNAYTLGNNKLEMFETADKNHTVSSNRTKIFDYVSAQFNSGQILLPTLPEVEILYKHIQNIKKIETVNEKGEDVSSWVASGPDHYAHALVYLTMASLIKDAGSFSYFAPPTIAEVEVGSRYVSST